MITIKIEFNHEGKTHKLTACLKNDMTISNSKNNQGYDIIEDNGDDKRWSLMFSTEEYPNIEAVMYRDSETNEMLLECDYLIIWHPKADCIEAEIEPSKQQQIYK